MSLTLPRQALAGRFPPAFHGARRRGGESHEGDRMRRVMAVMEGRGPQFNCMTEIRMRSLARSLACLTCMALLSGTTAFGGEADVISAKLVPEPSGTYRVEVTLAHDDEGWDHYANAWQVVAPDGSVLATRVLYHPHVAEQPFTRYLSGVAIPEGIETVTVRGQDSLHGLGGKTLVLEVPR